MGLKVRFALILAVVVAAAAGLSVIFGYLFTRSSLLNEVDEYLVEQARSVSAPGLGILASSPDLFLPDTRAPSPQLFPSDRSFSNAEGNPDDAIFFEPNLDDWVYAFITDSGIQIQESDSFSIPISAEDRQLAQDGGIDGKSYLYRTENVADIKLRIYTQAQPGGAVLIAVSVDNIETALDNLVLRAIIFGIIITLVVALLGWAASFWIVSPLNRLSRVAERITRTGELGESLQIRSQKARHEIGKLVRVFNSMLGELRVSKEQQKNLIDNAGHELKTPLTSIGLNVELLKNKYNKLSNEDRKKLLDAIYEETGSLRELVEEMIEISTVGTLDSESYEDLTLEEIANYTAGVANRRWGVDVAVSSAGPSEVIVGERRMLERAVLNMLGNSSKFNSGHDLIEIEVNGRKLEVKDRGPGVPEDDLPKIFSRFHRVLNYGHTQGSGLGLAIVSDIVENHDGKVWAKNREGGGLVVGFEVGANTEDANIREDKNTEIINPEEEK